jgi:hypothetical protein
MNAMVCQDEFDFGHEIRFGGDTYEPDLDHDRLKAQLERVKSLMADSEWRTLFEVANLTGFPTQSVSARLRDFRKERFGGHTVNRRRRGEGKRGLFEYQLILHDWGMERQVGESG